MALTLYVPSAESVADNPGDLVPSISILDRPAFIPDRVSVAVNATLTTLLFQPLIFGEGETEGGSGMVGRVVSILSVTCEKLVLPGKSVAGPEVNVCCFPSLITCIGKALGHVCTLSVVPGVSSGSEQLKLAVTDPGRVPRS